MRTCYRCGTEKAADQFPAGRNRCKECKLGDYRAWRAANPAYEREWRAANPERTKSAQLKINYGITLEEWGVMLGKQEGLCAICCSVLDRGQHTHVDHDHQTGIVRALLCSHCNRGLGGFQDSAENLVLAAKYIQDHAARAVA